MSEFILWCDIGGNRHSTNIDNIADVVRFDTPNEWGDKATGKVTLNYQDEDGLNEWHYVLEADLQVLEAAVKARSQHEQ